VNTPARLSLPLLTNLQVRHRTYELAAAIARDLNGCPVVAVIILKGAFLFGSNLVQRLAEFGLEVQVEFMRAASYGVDDQSSGKISLQLDTTGDLAGSHVLLIDDILDTGLTLIELQRRLAAKSPLSLRTTVLLRKDIPREPDVPIDYIGFEVPNRFIVGHGIDYAGRYRHLPNIHYLEREPA